MSQLIIRLARREDIEEIVTLEELCFATPWSRESLEHDMFNNRMSTYLVAELESRVVGYMGFWTIVDEAHVNNVAVSPEYRRLHIGSAIIDTFIRMTSEAGIESQTLEVRAGNGPAIGLYRKFGFEEAGIRPGYYENGEDAIIMWRRQTNEGK